MAGSNALAALRYQGGVVANVQSTVAPIATTGNTDTYVVAPEDGELTGVDFSSLNSLVASDSNYVTFAIVNMGQGGIGTANMLALTNANTSKLTGGTAIAANTRRKLSLSVPKDLKVKAGDRLRIRVVATGTLPSTLDYSIFLLRFVA